MIKILTLVRKRRDARREAAIGRLASSQKVLASATAAWQKATSQVAEAQAWRTELLQRDGEGLHPSWRTTVLPSCVALIGQREVEARIALKVIEQRRREVAGHRAELTRCEKALLRTDELRKILKTQADECARIDEQSQEDDLTVSYGRTRMGSAWK